MWPIDPAGLRPPEGWRGWPDGKKFAFILTHDVETLGGQEKVKELAGIEIDLGFRSSFNFVPERYAVSTELRAWLRDHGFEVGVHDLNHDGNLYSSKKAFAKRSVRINEYLHEWRATGFRSGAMFHNLEWIGMLNIDYDGSTFDTDPFEPQPDGVGTIFPFCIKRDSGNPYVELPYTLAQDFTLFILFREKSIEVWKTKLDWIANAGGMALVNVHPDYIDFRGPRVGRELYHVQKYDQLLDYCNEKYKGEFWNVIPGQLARHILTHPVYLASNQNKPGKITNGIIKTRFGL